MASEKELKLQLLIAEVLQERGMIKDGEALGDFLVMCEIANWTEAGRGKTKYANIIPGDNGLPAHRLLGLIEVCGDLLEFQDE